MNIVEALGDPKLFRRFLANKDNSLASWSNWLAFLRVLYGVTPLPRDHDIIEESTGRSVDSFAPEQEFGEALVLVGRRGGKSKVIALVGAFEAVLSGKEKLCSPGEIPMVGILSPTRVQSRIIHSYLRAVFDSSPILQKEISSEEQTGFKLKNRVEIRIITGDPKHCRGFPLIAAIVDEIAFFGLTEESKVRNDTELVRSIRPSLASVGGRLFLVGTPYAAKGHAYKSWKVNFANPTSRVLVWNASSLGMNPTLNPLIVARAVEEDPIAAECEYATRPGLFREDVDSFIPRRVVELLVIRGRVELPPLSNITYVAFCDMSGGRVDDAALCVAHKQNRLIIVDLLQRWKSPHNPHNVVFAMCETLKRYGLVEVIGDAYSAEWCVSTFAENGVKYSRAMRSEWRTGSQSWKSVAKPKSQLYATLLPILTSGEIELPDDEILVNQLSSLERRTHSGGRDVIDHPRGGHDDLSNVLAGVASYARQTKIIAGAVQRTPSVNTPIEQTTRAIDKMMVDLKRDEDFINGNQGLGCSSGSHENQVAALQHLHRTDPFFKQFRK